MLVYLTLTFALDSCFIKF